MEKRAESGRKMGRRTLYEFRYVFVRPTQPRQDMDTERGHVSLSTKDQFIHALARRGEESAS